MQAGPVMCPGPELFGRPAFFFMLLSMNQSTTFFVCQCRKRMVSPHVERRWMAEARYAVE